MSFSLLILSLLKRKTHTLYGLRFRGWDVHVSAYVMVRSAPRTAALVNKHQNGKFLPRDVTWSPLKMAYLLWINVLQVHDDSDLQF